MTQILLPIFLLIALAQSAHADLRQEASTFISDQNVTVVDLRLNCKNESTSTELEFLAYFGPGYLHAFYESHDKTQSMYLANGSSKPNCLQGYWYQEGDKKPRRHQLCSPDFVPELSFFKGQNTLNVWVPEKHNQKRQFGRCEIEVRDILEDISGESRVGTFWRSQDLVAQLNILDSIYKDYEAKKAGATRLLSKINLMSGGPNFEEFGDELVQVDQLLREMKKSPETQVASINPNVTIQKAEQQDSQQIILLPSSSGALETDLTIENAANVTVAKKAEEDANRAAELAAAKAAAKKAEEDANRAAELVAAKKAEEDANRAAELAAAKKVEAEFLYADVVKFIRNEPDVDVVRFAELYNSRPSLDLDWSDLQISKFDALKTSFFEEETFKDFFLEQENLRAKQALDLRLSLEGSLNEKTLVLEKMLVDYFGSSIGTEALMLIKESRELSANLALKTDDEIKNFISKIGSLIAIEEEVQSQISQLKLIKFDLIAIVENSSSGVAGSSDFDCSGVCSIATQLKRDIDLEMDSKDLLDQQKFTELVSRATNFIKLNLPAQKTNNADVVEATNEPKQNSQVPTAADNQNKIVQEALDDAGQIEVSIRSCKDTFSTNEEKDDFGKVVGHAYFPGFALQYEISNQTEFPLAVKQLGTEFSRDLGPFYTTQKITSFAGPIAPEMSSIFNKQYVYAHLTYIKSKTKLSQEEEKSIRKKHGCSKENFSEQKIYLDLGLSKFKFPPEAENLNPLDLIKVNSDLQDLELIIR